jgi:hypothetical protein
LSKSIARYGNTWFGIATYHSGTPYFNNRYQILLRNELIKSGVIEGKLEKVPPFKRSGSQQKSSSRKSSASTVVATSTGKSISFDSPTDQ